MAIHGGIAGAISGWVRWLLPLAVALVSLGPRAATAAGPGTITEFPLPTVGSAPFGITVGPDTNFWFVENAGNKIGRITPAGTVTEFPIPTPNSYPVAITAGPDGNLWFTELYANKIGRITTNGTITEFAGGNGPRVITSGPDGNLYFTNSGPGLGRITPSGTILLFPGPTASTFGITVGPDANLWFTEDNANMIGRFDPQGVLLEIPLPQPNSSPSSITAGPDGNVWFTEFLGGRIGRITPAGTITEFTIPTQGSAPNGIAEGPDGNLWFTDWNHDTVDVVNPAGAMIAFQTPTVPSGVEFIATGPDGYLWFTEARANRIARILPTALAALTAPAQVNVGLGPGTLSYTNLKGAFASNWIAVPGAVNYQLALGVSPFDTRLFYFGRNLGNVTQAVESLTDAQLVDGGTYFVSVRGFDSTGTPAGWATSNAYTVDITPPIASLTTPSSGAVTNQRLLAATATDALSGVASVQFQRSLDGSTWTNVGRPLTSSPYQLSPSASDLPDGAQQVRATATDRAGNSAISAAVAFTLDTTPPVHSLAQPQRLVDTRTSGGPIAPGSSRCFGVASLAGIPADAGAVVLNVTAVGYSNIGWLTLYPNGQPVPSTSTLNFDSTEYAIANGAIIGLGSGGQVCVNAGNSASNVILDATGFVTRAGLGLMPTLATPERLVDTRSTGGLIAAGSSRCFPIAGQSGVPNDAAAVILNVTAVSYTNFGWLTLYPNGQPLPATSILNFDPHQYAVANGTMVKLGTGGQVCVNAGNSASNVILDATGYVTAAGLTRVSMLPSPQRLVDTRTSGGPIAAGSSRCFVLAGQGGIPVNATAVIVNVTAVGYASIGWLTLYPNGQALPATSTLNFDPHEYAIANGTLIGVGAGGQVCVNAGNSASQVIIDVTGNLLP